MTGETESLRRRRPDPVRDQVWFPATLICRIHVKSAMKANLRAFAVLQPYHPPMIATGGGSAPNHELTVLERPNFLSALAGCRNSFDDEPVASPLRL